MPNWCYTDYCFYADTDKGREQLKSFYTTLDKSISHKKRVLESDFGDNWLGNVILEFCPQFLVLTSDNVECRYNRKYIRFRGTVNCLDEPEEFDGEMFRMQTMTAWGPMKDMWTMILTECGFDEVKYVYEAEEPGEGLYINSDTKGRFLADRIRMEISISDKFYKYCTEYFVSKKEALGFMNKVIVDLRDEYKKHPERYELPEGYSPKVLRKQRSFVKALELLEGNIFSSGDANSYITCNIFTTK